MTVIVINAISVKEGGSLVVLRELLMAMCAIKPAWIWHVVVNSEARKNLPDLAGVRYVHLAGIEKSGLRTRVWYETGLPLLLHQTGANLLFSTTNYLPFRRMPCATLLLVQHAGHFSALFRHLTEAGLGFARRLAWRMKGHWVRASVRGADAVTVQTNELAGQVAAQLRFAQDRIHVIAHGAGQAVPQASPVAAPARNAKFRVGYITKFGVQKNFDVLFDAIARLRKTGLPLALVLTLSEQGAENQAVLQSARQFGIDDLIENRGELSGAEIDHLYKSLHAFVFPSLCESFGFPMVEAMTYGIPLLVADTDSNIEVLGSGGQSFPAQDAEALANALGDLARDTDWFRQQALASLNRSKDFSWKQTASSTVALMEQVMAGHDSRTIRNQSKP